MSYTSVKTRVDALPEPERSARRSLYTDHEWATLWELNAWPHQLAPQGDDWEAWTVIGPPGTGKTVAGYMWLREKFYQTDKVLNLIGILRHPKEIQRLGALYQAEIEQRGFQDYFTYSSTFTRVRIEEKNPLTYPTRLHLVSESEVESGMIRGLKYDYVWADQVADANMIQYHMPAAKQFVFTDPARLVEATLLSQAAPL